MFSNHLLPIEENENCQNKLTPREMPKDLCLLAEMFGGMDKLWNTKKRGPLPPGCNLFSLASGKLSSPLPASASRRTPREVLLCHGVVESRVTKKLFAYADRDVLVPGLSIEHIAKRLLYSFFQAWSVSFDPPSGSEEELDYLKEDTVHSFDGIGIGTTAQFFPVSFAEENGRDIDKDEKSRLMEVILEFFGPVPANHLRFYHGTDSQVATDIVLEGVDCRSFEALSDFGPGFYCTKNINVAFEYGMKQGISMEREGRRGAIMAFDVPSETYEACSKFEFTDDTHWKLIVSGLRGVARKRKLALNALGRNTAVIIGKFSNARYDNTTDPQPSGNELQYAFCQDHGNLLLRDRAKVKVAVFDVGGVDEDGDY